MPLIIASAVGAVAGFFVGTKTSQILPLVFLAGTAFLVFTKGKK